MARVRAEKKYNTFVKGLVTEANPLTYPENASLDEENFVLKRDGSRHRRLGIDFETGHTAIPTGLAAASIETGRQSFHKWENPGSDSSVSIGVARVGGKLWFLDLLTDAPSSNLLNGGAAITLPLSDNLDIETAVVNSYLVMVGGGLEFPLAFYYDRTTQLVNYEAVPLQVRDIWGIVDGLSISERPATLENDHQYNLINQGWNASVPTESSYTTRAVEHLTVYLERTGGAVPAEFQYVMAVTASPIACIETTRDVLGVFPSNADIWTLGKNEVTSDVNYGTYYPRVMEKFSVDGMPAPKGSMVLDAFNRGYSRTLLTGLSDLPLDKEVGKLATIASYASRVFYAGVESDVTDGDSKSPNYSNMIFFSQVVTDSSKLGACYQEADPTSDRMSELVDTDGGVVHIPEATKIVKLVATRSSILVFAENGVWELYGDTKGFVATSYQVSKLSSNGCSSPKSIVEASGTIFGWTKAGIYMYAIEPTSGRYSAQNFSLQSVQTLYNNLDEVTKVNARGFYDERENTIRWLYNDSESYSSTLYVNRYNKELTLDLTLQAYSKQSIDTALGPYVADYADIPGYAVVTNLEAVYVGTDEALVDTDAVTVEVDSTIARTSQFSFLVISGTSFTLGKYSNRSFMDWQSFDGNGVDFSSYLLTGYDTFGSIGSKKQVPYLWMHFERTESGYNNIGGSMELDNPSGCRVQSQWDWTNSANSGKWSNSFQAYRLLRHYTPSGVADIFDYGYEVIMTKNKLRGSGKSLSLLIQSEAGKDMKLLGWSLLVEVGR